MTLTVRQAAEFLRASDDYQDRTGDLRENTKEVVEATGDPVTVSLVMDTEYASYVKNRGFSHFDEAVVTIDEMLTAGFREMRKRISG